LSEQINKQGIGKKLNNRETRMTGNKHLSILTLNVIASMAQTKDTE
jgi:hypothetical protein